MATRPGRLKSVSAPRSTKQPPAPALAVMPSVLDERAHQIQALAKKVEEYCRFMCAIVHDTQISQEARTKAIIAFCDRLTIVEQQLGRIHDEFRLE